MTKPAVWSDTDMSSPTPEQAAPSADCDGSCGPWVSPAHWLRSLGASLKDASRTEQQITLSCDYAWSLGTRMVQVAECIERDRRQAQSAGPAPCL